MMRCWLLMLACALPRMADATLVWSAADAGGHGAHAAHQGHGRRPGATITLQDGEGASTQLWLPTLEQRPLPLADGVIQLKPSGMDNYHLLLAVRESTGVHESALRYLYLNGKPSGRSPAELIYVEKVPLEIVPTPLTREHARYLGEGSVRFMVRFAGEPLSQQPITLQTSNGTWLEATSDSQGRVSFTLPDDFQEIKAGRDNNQPADFYLYTAYRHADKEYRTTFSAPYHVNPRHWQTQSGAVLSGVAGFAAGISILVLVARRQRRRGETV